MLRGALCRNDHYSDRRHCCREEWWPARMLSQSLRANQTSATFANTPYNHVRLEARNLALPPEPVLNDTFFAVSQVK